jgi:hypothetical protein
MEEIEKRLLICLMELLHQVDEDCPQEYRTKHLKEAMKDANDLIIEEQLKMGRLAP